MDGRTGCIKYKLFRYTLYRATWIHGVAMTPACTKTHCAVAPLARLPRPAVPDSTHNVKMPIHDEMTTEPQDDYNIDLFASEQNHASAEEVERIRVLVVDDHEVVRKGICAILDEQDDFEVVAQTSNGNNAVVLATQTHPDIVLLDVHLGIVNGLDVAQQLCRACPKTSIVIFTGLTDDIHLLHAMRIGVHGYLQKAQPLSELLAALRAVYRGERVLGEAHAVTQVLAEFTRLTREQERLRSGLSDTEIELVKLAAEGCSNKEIASRQFWSEVTVKRKMQDIYRKLQVADRTQAVVEAMRMGLI